jgi:hypothetical protein
MVRAQAGALDGIPQAIFRRTARQPAVEALRDVIATGPVTLIYGAKDERHNQAVALAEFLGGPASPAAKEHDR